MSGSGIRKSDAGLNGASFRSRHLAAARALAARDWEKPSVILRARHMADAGATVQEISDALGWGVSYLAAKRRLLKYRIRPFAAKQGPGAHRGHKAYLNPRTAVGFEIFRARTLEVAE